MSEWQELMVEINRELDESHIRTVKLHNEIMADIERIERNKGN